MLNYQFIFEVNLGRLLRGTDLGYGKTDRSVG